MGEVSVYPYISEIQWLREDGRAVEEQEDFASIEWYPDRRQETLFFAERDCYNLQAYENHFFFIQILLLSKNGQCFKENDTVYK